MELRTSPLWQEVLAITQEQSPLPPLYAWKVEFTANGQAVVPFKVISILNKRDFRNAYGHEIELTVLLPAGDYLYDIYPYRRNLIATIRREGRQRSSDDALTNPDIVAQQYRAVLIDDSSSVVEGALNNVQSKNALNLTDVKTIRFQLMDLALERIRMHSVGGVFRDTTPAQVLEYIVTSVSTALPLDDTNKIRGVQMVASPNQDAYAHIVIPHGTKFPELPIFMNKKVGGIYPTGMSMHLQAQMWYIYPLYDLTRFDNPAGSRTLTLINVPVNQFPNVELTYRTTPGQVIALVTGEVIHSDSSESKLLNAGNGVRYMDARRTMGDFADTTGGTNKAVATRAENNNEFVTDARSTNLNNVVTSSARITANKFYEMSKLAARAGADLQCLWQNSDPTLIEPGMPVKYLYIKDDAIHELRGTVLGAIDYTQTYGTGVTDTRHITETALHLFVEREQSN